MPTSTARFVQCQLAILQPNLYDIKHLVLSSSLSVFTILKHQNLAVFQHMNGHWQILYSIWSRLPFLHSYDGDYWVTDVS